jgi:hypothetical protein
MSRFREPMARASMTNMTPTARLLSVNLLRSFDARSRTVRSARFLSAALPLLLLPGCAGDEAETFENTRDALSIAVGDPCILDAEDDPRFSGYSPNEVALGSGNCEVGSCMAYHFQGRVSCPDGQADAEGTCQTPSGLDVLVPVEAQSSERPAEDHVMCTCRCDGPEGSGPFCGCPTGFTCAKALDDLGLGGDDVAGSYCVPSEAVE